MTSSELQDLLIKAIEQNDPKQKAEFEALAKQALRQHPDKWDLNMLLGTFYVHEKESELGIPLLRYASMLNPKSPEIMNNLGNAYRQNYHHKEAKEWFMRALKRSPDDPDLYTNMGTIHINEGSPDQAEKYLRKAVELGGQAKARWNLALALLEQEKFAEGFYEYAYGLTCGDRVPKVYPTALAWDGKDHADDTLVVFGEQGLGDEIMWASCINDLQGRFGKVIIDCHPRLVTLLERSFPWVEVRGTRKTISMDDAANDWVKVANPEWQVSIADLPLFLRKSEADFPKAAYLKADRALVDEYKQWLSLVGDGPYIGLSWVGGTHDTRTDLRSMTLDMMLPVLDSIDGTFISCQYTSANKDVSKYRTDHGVRIFDFPEVFEASRWERWSVIDHKGDVCAIAKDKIAAKDFINRYGGTIRHHAGPGYNFDETAAFVTAIYEMGGYIISVNNTLVHLCGALGVECHVLTPSKPAWRYGLKRRDMVWYGNWVTQYRQRGADWTSALEQLITDLMEKRNAA